MYKLINAEERAQLYPESFKIPEARIRNNLHAHDRVRLMFEPAEQGPVERLWVRVCGPTAPSATYRYVGQVDNRAENRTLPKLGDMVEFGPEHVMAFETELGAIN